MGEQRHQQSSHVWQAPVQALPGGSKPFSLRSKCYLAMTAVMMTLTVSAIPPVSAAETESASLMEAITAGRPMTSFRLRYETIDQDGKREDANAMTLRSLLGWKTAPFHDFSVAAQLINVAVLNNRYDNFNKAVPESHRQDYPRVVDPDDTDINQLFVEWSGLANTRLRFGRQSVTLDNARFIGNVAFRQVMQVFDGLALENQGLIPNTDLYLAHFERVKQVTTKLQSAKVDIANLKYHIAPDVSLTGYGYLIDWSGELKAGNPNPKTTSSKTFGLRFDGSRALDDRWKVSYTAEYARQDDYRNGLSNIDADYLHLGGGVARSRWYVRVDHELLASNRGRSAFQTPLATGHIFQGWADQFGATPNEGLKDTFISFGGELLKVQLSAEYHWFDADKRFATPSGPGRGSRYGHEFDLAAAYSYADNWQFKTEYARFREDDVYGSQLTAATRKRDTEKFWLTAVYTF